jgi:hypothetical protein
MDEIEFKETMQKTNETNSSSKVNKIGKTLTRQRERERDSEGEREREREREREIA